MMYNLRKSMGRVIFGDNQNLNQYTEEQLNSHMEQNTIEMSSSDSFHSTEPEYGAELGQIELIRRNIHKNELHQAKTRQFDELIEKNSQFERACRSKRQKSAFINNKIINLMNITSSPKQKLDDVKTIYRTWTTETPISQEMVVPSNPVDRLMGDLTHEDKLIVFERLQADLQQQPNNEQSELSASEKLKTMIILLVHIIFLSMGILLPVLNIIYSKFINNEFLVFNYNNLNRVLELVIRALDKLKSKLQAYQQKRVESHETSEEEMPSNATDLAGITLTYIASRYTGTLFQGSKDNQGSFVQTIENFINSLS